MKHYILKGFAVLVCLLDDGKNVEVYPQEGGEAITKDKKSKAYLLPCADESGNVEPDWMPIIGSNYSFTNKQLLEMAEDNGGWIEGSPFTDEDGNEGEGEGEDAPELTEAQKKALEVKAKVKELRAAVALAKKNMEAAITAHMEKPNGAVSIKAITDAGEVRKSAELELAQYLEDNGGAVKTERIVTQAEVDSIAALDLQKAEIGTLTEKLESAIAVHNATEGFAKYGKKASSGGSGGGGERILDYELAQEIRAKYAKLLKEGKTEAEAIKACVTYEVNRTAVTRVVTYRQHLLKTEDKAFLKVLPFNDEFYNRFAGQTMDDAGVPGADAKEKANNWYKKIGE